jgi:proline iminopeptidase
MRIDGEVMTEDGVRLYVQKRGRGERMVVIPNGFYFADDFAGLENDRTLAVYDLRNRGRSETVADATKLQRGILQDADDLEAVRRDLGVERLDLVGHSYVGLMVMVYAIAHPERVNRIVLIGPMPPSQKTQYPPHLTNVDDTLLGTLTQLGELEKLRASLEPEAYCRRVWTLLRLIYVADPAHAERVDWGRCDLPNERRFMAYWMERILPSIYRLEITPADMAKVTAPVLVVHGTRDRSAPYGGGRSWALGLPDARLVTIDRVAHAPWIESPAVTHSAIETFLNGAWPEAAQKIESLDQ